METNLKLSQDFLLHQRSHRKSKVVKQNTENENLDKMNRKKVCKMIMFRNKLLLRKTNIVTNMTLCNFPNLLNHSIKIGKKHE